MLMEKVESSNVAAVGYELSTETLRVEFKSGAIYDYSDVPELVHKQLVGAPSVGSFFNSTIKNSYQFERIS